MIWRILLYGFLAYLLYKVVFELIIPVFKTTRKMKKDFKEMRNRMNDFTKQQQPGVNQQHKPKEPSEKSGKPGDYIEFEDVK